MVDAFCGITYKLLNSEDLADQMQLFAKKLVNPEIDNTVSPVIELIKDDEEDAYTLRTESTFNNSNKSFKLAEEFEQVTMSGRIIKTMITCEDNKLIEMQEDEDGYITTIVREFSESEIKAVITCDGAVSNCVYQAS